MYKRQLDKGRGYLSTVLIQAGTLKVGDIVIAGSHHGRVKAMYNHLGVKQTDAGPSTPVLVLGLNGAPQAGDKFNVLESEREAREVATKGNRSFVSRISGRKSISHLMKLADVLPLDPLRS